jgi:hypothetical protein
MRVNNPDRSPSLAYTDRARIVFDYRTANDPAMMSSTISARFTAHGAL